MAHTRRTLLWTAVLAVLLIALVNGLDLLRWNGFVSDLLRRGSAAGLISLVVLTVVVWVGLFVLLCFFQGARERRVIGRIQRALEGPRGTASPSGLDSFLREQVGAASYDGSLVKTRFALLQRVPGETREDFLSFLMASQSGMDAARSEASFGPARALVWALPALGFLGTASEMSQAVGGLGEAVARTASYSDLRGFLVRDVIPPLANAFDVTLFALGATVVSHLLLTVLLSREQQILLDADAVALTALTGTAGSHRAPAAGALTGDVDGLAVAINESSRTLSETNRRLTDHLEPVDTERVTALLAAIDGRLGSVVEALNRDLVVRRSA